MDNVKEVEVEAQPHPLLEPSVQNTAYLSGVIPLAGALQVKVTELASCENERLVGGFMKVGVGATPLE